MYIPIFGVEREIGVDFLKVTAQADDLRKMRESSLSVWNEVIYLYEFQPSGTVYKKCGAGYMEKPFWAGEEVEAVIASIRSYLETVRKNEMITRQFFAVIKDGRTQMVYVWLSEMGDLCQCTFFR